MRLSASCMPTRTNGKIHRIVRRIIVVPNKNFIKQRRWQHSNSPPPSPVPKKPTVVSERSKSFAIGAIAGTCGSLAGMGGGFVMVPLMTSKRLFQLGLTQHQAHATSLFAVATTGLAGALSYSGEVDYEVAAFVALSGMATASLGAHASARLSEKVLRRVLGVFMLAVAPTIIAKDYLVTTETAAEKINLAQARDKDDESDGDTSSSSEVALRRIKASGIGCCSGFLAGMFGVGGGAVVVPALSLVMDMNHYQALGTSLCGTSEMKI